MNLESYFDKVWSRGDVVKRPKIRVLKIYDKEHPNKLYRQLLIEQIERRNSYNNEIYELEILYRAIQLGEYEDGKFGKKYSFCASYNNNFNRNKISLTGGAVFLDPNDLRGYRVGTYLMNSVIEWAKQWPEADIETIQLLENNENKERRNRFYEQFGLSFIYKDANNESGQSETIKAKDLKCSLVWEQNIKEMPMTEYLEDLFRENINLKQKNQRLGCALEDMKKDISNIEDNPLRWAVKFMFNRYLSRIFFW